MFATADLSPRPSGMGRRVRLGDGRELSALLLVAAEGG